MSRQWYYEIEGEELGPVSSSELKHVALEGQIDRNTPVRKETSENWVPAGRIKGLFVDSPQRSWQSEEPLEKFLGSLSADESKSNALPSPTPKELVQLPATIVSSVTHAPREIAKPSKAPASPTAGFWAIPAAALFLGLAIGVAGTLAFGKFVSPNNATKQAIVASSPPGAPDTDTATFNSTDKPKQQREDSTQSVGRRDSGGGGFPVESV